MLKSKLMRVAKFVWIFCLILVLSSCNNQRINQLKQRLSKRYEIVKEEVIERLKVGLSELPIIGKHISLPPAPKELYEETKAIFEKLKTYKAQEVYPKEYQTLVEKWGEIQNLYESRYYLSAKRELKQLYPEAKEFLQKVEKYHQEVEEKAWKKYKEVESRLKKLIKKGKLKDILKVKLYLWKLKTLIKMENYDEFYRESSKLPF